MSDDSKTPIIIPGRGAKTLPPVSPDEPARERQPLPSSVLKERRGDRSQTEIARDAGMSQGYLSELERGHKLLTPGVAQRLAQALGMPANQLMIDELLASLNRVAQKGQIDLRPLLTEADRLTEILPAGEIGDEIIMALARILRERQKLTN